MNNFTKYDVSQINIDEVIIYLRKSRAEGKETVEEVLSRHERILQDFALETFGFKIPERNIYREVVSGETIDERIEIKKVFQRLEKEDIKVCLVIEPQRLSRGDMLDCGRIVHMFKYSHTLIATVTKIYDLDDKFDQQIFEMELTQGNKYLEYHKEIMDRGKNISLREGKYIASTAPFGYNRKKLDKGFMLIINPPEAEVVKIIFEMFVESNLSSQELATYLNINEYKSRSGKLWDYEMVRHVLNNETYYGNLVWGKRRTLKKLVDGQLTKFREKTKDYMLVRGQHEPIITKEMFDMAQAKIKNHKSSRVGLNKELQNPIAGIVFCKKCGRSLVRIKNRRQGKKRNKVRKYEIDKAAINSLIREAKDRLNISYTEIAEFLKVSRNSVITWFAPKLEKAYYNELFASKWFELKFLLEIDADEHDKQITTYVDPPELKDTFACSNPNCDMVSSCLQVVEEVILNELRNKLEEFNHYIDNYEEEIIKERTDNEKMLKKIDTKLSELNKELKNLRRAYNREEFTYEEYMEDKKDIEAEIKEIETAKSKILDTEEEQQLYRYKKSIPILEECLKDYDTLSIPEKNQLLKSIIEKVVYSKTTRLNWRVEAEDDMELEIHMNI